MDEQERLCLLALSHVEFLRPREKLALVEMLGGAARLFRLDRGQIAGLIGRRLATREWRPDEILAEAERTAKRLTADATQSIFYWESAYPPQLREIFDPPVTLYLRGTLPAPADSLAGVVGTRFPTGEARTAAFRLGFELGRNGVGVVSGLARGIDREAHEGCLHAGGTSVAVLGSGIDVVYPSSSAGTARAVLAGGGAVLSEYPPGVPPLRWHFPARNRIISGLSRSVVVVQAPERSGALITADYALEQGRDLWVHQDGCEGGAGAGTRRLAEAGAPLLCGAAELLADWGREPRPHAAPAHEHGMAEAGTRLAALLEDEMRGACTTRAGEGYWRE
jgi:DNA processing protein